MGTRLAGCEGSVYLNNNEAGAAVVGLGEVHGALVGGYVETLHAGALFEDRPCTGDMERCKKEGSKGLHGEVAVKNNRLWK